MAEPADADLDEVALPGVQESEAAQTLTWDRASSWQTAGYLARDHGEQAAATEA